MIATQLEILSLESSSGAYRGLSMAVDLVICTFYPQEEMQKGKQLSVWSTSGRLHGSKPSFSTEVT